MAAAEVHLHLANRCTNGTVYDPASGNCLCPTGQTWSLRSRTSGACPPGMLFDGKTDSCACAPRNPAWNAQKKKCQACSGVRGERAIAHSFTSAFVRDGVGVPHR